MAYKVKRMSHAHPKSFALANVYVGLYVQVDLFGASVRLLKLGRDQKVDTLYQLLRKFLLET